MQGNREEEAEKMLALRTEHDSPIPLEKCQETQKDRQVWRDHTSKRLRLA